MRLILTIKAWKYPQAGHASPANSGILTRATLVRRGEMKLAAAGLAVVLDDGVLEQDDDGVVASHITVNLTPYPNVGPLSNLRHVFSRRR